MKKLLISTLIILSAQTAYTTRGLVVPGAAPVATTAVVSTAPTTISFVDPKYAADWAAITAILDGKADNIDDEITNLQALIKALGTRKPNKNLTKANRDILIKSLDDKIDVIDAHLASFTEKRDYLRDTDQAKALLKCRIGLANAKIKLADTFTGYTTWLNSQFKSNWRKPIYVALAIPAYYAGKNVVSFLTTTK